MARLPADEVGRGNQDPSETVIISPVKQRVTITVATGSTKTSFATQVDLVLGVPGNTISVGILNGVPTGSPDISVNISGVGIPDTVGGIANSIRFFITANSNFDAPFVGDDRGDFAVTNVTGGVADSPTTSNSALIDTVETVPGRASRSFEEEIFTYTGPFSNVAPFNDPLQGLARAAMSYSDFFRSLVTATESELDGITTILQANLLASFPNNLVPNATRTDGNRRISIKGSRRNSLGFVGRGKRDLSYTFINETADYGLRQLILRIYDSMIDLFLEISNNINDISALNDFASLILREFEIEIGELERAIGKEAVLYENTIVNDSSDQGLLLYSDELATFASAYVATGTDTLATWQTAMASAFANRTNKLLLKN